MMKSASRAKARGLPTAASAKKTKTVPVAAAKKPRKAAQSTSKRPAPKLDREKAAAKIHALNEASGGKNDRAARIAAQVGRGVTMRPSGKWQAQLYYAGQSRYIGVFESREKATLAYEIAREILKGGKAPSQPGEAAEKAVEAARKAAFNGVNETSLIKVIGSPEGRADVRKSPKTPFTTASSSTARSSEDRNSIKAIKAAEILKGMFGVAVAASSSLDESEEEVEEEDDTEEDSEEKPVSVPLWIQQLRGKMPAWVEADRNSYGERLVCEEWELKEYRVKSGWKGCDFMHDDDSPVNITEYFANYASGDGTSLKKGGEGTTLTGIVHFTARAESHQGFCHGGSMTAVMDDIVGWAAFLATGSCKPWTGFTVQINTSLRKPIPVNSWLLVCGVISKIEGRKVTVTATITDPANENDVHAEGDGLVVLNAGVLPGT